MNNDIIDLVSSDAGRKAMEGAGGVAEIPKRMLEASRQFKPIFRRALAEQWKAAQGAQVITERRRRLSHRRGPRYRRHHDRCHPYLGSDQRLPTHRRP
jgi:hypothetical protein